MARGGPMVLLLLKQKKSDESILYQFKPIDNMDLQGIRIVFYLIVKIMVQYLIFINYN